MSFEIAYDELFWSNLLFSLAYSFFLLFLKILGWFSFGEWIKIDQRLSFISHRLNCLLKTFVIWIVGRCLECLDFCLSLPFVSRWFFSDRFVSIIWITKRYIESLGLFLLDAFSYINSFLQRNKFVFVNLNPSELSYFWLKCFLFWLNTHLTFGRYTLFFFTKFPWEVTTPWTRSIVFLCVCKFTIPCLVVFFKFLFHSALIHR